MLRSHHPDETPPPTPSGRVSVLAAAFRVLLPLGPNPEISTATWARAVWWFVPVGLLIGLAWAAVFRASWRIFGEVGGLCPIPALVVVLADVAILGHRQYWGLGRILPLSSVGGRSLEGGDERDHATTRVLLIGMTVLALWVLLVSIPKGSGWWPTDWRADLHLTKLYPRPVFRPLILAPMWGRWAILMAGNVGRVRVGSNAVGLCEAVRPVIVLMNFAPVVVLTAVYCSRGGNPLLGLIIGLVVLGVTHLASTVLALRRGGQDFASLFAVSKLAELTFLLAYVAASSR